MTYLYVVRFFRHYERKNVTLEVTYHSPEGYKS